MLINPLLLPEAEYIHQLEILTFNFLREFPFPRDHPERLSMVRLCVQPACELELVCFLLENGAVVLYERIQNALHNELYDLPIIIRNRFENSYLKYIAEASNEAFMHDHEKRQRADSVADRLDEIIAKYPLRLATEQMVTNCPKCAICQYNIRKRQHVRRTCESCIFHRKCCDEFLLQSRTCAICRVQLITDS